MKKHTLPIVLSSIIALTAGAQNAAGGVLQDTAGLLLCPGCSILFGSDYLGKVDNAATNAVTNAVDWTQDKVQQGVQWVADGVERGINTAKEVAGDIRDWGVRVAQNAEEMVRDGWYQMGEYYTKVADNVNMVIQTEKCRYRVKFDAAKNLFSRIGDITQERWLEFTTCLDKQNEWATMLDYLTGAPARNVLKCHVYVSASSNRGEVYNAIKEMYNARLTGYQESCGQNATAQQVYMAGVPVLLGPIVGVAALAKNVAVTSAGASIVSENSASDYSTECPRVDFGVIDNAGRCQDACKQYEELNVCLLSGVNPYSYNGVSKQCICNPDKVAGSVATTTVPTQATPKVGDVCSTQYSTSAQYINVGGGEIKCAATACQPGSYLVKNEQGVSQGWCKWGTDPEVLRQQRAAEIAAIGEIAKLDTVSAQVAVGNSLATQVSGPVIEQRAVTPVMDPVEMARKKAELAKLELEAAEARQKAEEKQMKAELKATEKQERQAEREANQLARQQEREANQLARQQERDAKAAEKEAAALAKAAEKEAAAKAEAEKKAAADAMGMTVHQYDKYQQNMAEQELLKQQLGII